jgi:hypothetical protein
MELSLNGRKKVIMIVHGMALYLPESTETNEHVFGYKQQ